MSVQNHQKRSLNLKLLSNMWDILSFMYNRLNLFELKQNAGLRCVQPGSASYGRMKQRWTCTKIMGRKEYGERKEQIGRAHV